MKDQSSIIDVRRVKSLETSDGDEIGAFAIEDLDKVEKHLMSVLTNLYANPYAAAYQETLSNAYDSHKRAGNKADAIEVFFAYDNGTQLTRDEVIAASKSSAGVQAYSNSLFNYSSMTHTDARNIVRRMKSKNVCMVVRDYGTGMSLEDLKNRFFKYGASDKRESVEERGGFGLGCKAGVAISGRLDVVSVKDGIKTKASSVMNTKENAVIYKNLGVTDEKSGTTVYTHFELNSINKFLAAMISPKLLTFWDETPLSLLGKIWDGKESIKRNPAAHDFTHIPHHAGDIWLNTSDKRYVGNESKIKINLGGVMYDISLIKLGIFEHLKIDYMLRFDVPLTSLVSLVPSRESILYDDRTIDNLKSMIKDKMSIVEDFALMAVSSSSTPREAAVTAHKNFSVIKNISNYNNILQWRGKRIFQKISGQHPCDKRYEVGTIKSNHFDAQTASIPGDHPALINNHRLMTAVLVSVPESLNLESAKDMQKLSLAARRIAANVKLVEKLASTQEAYAPHQVIFDITRKTVKEIQADSNFLSRYEVIYTLDEIIAERARIDKILADTEVKIDKSTIPRHLVIRPGSGKVEMVSDKDLSDDEIIIITADTINKDHVNGILQHHTGKKMLEQHRISWLSRMISDDVEMVQAAFPKATLLLLPHSRRTSPLFKTFPEAQTLFSKIAEKIDFSKVADFETALISTHWRGSYRLISEVAKRNKFQHAETISEMMIESIDKDKNKSYEGLDLLYNSIRFVFLKAPDYMRDNEDKTLEYLSENFITQKDSSQMLNIVKLIKSLKFNTVYARFNKESVYRFFDVIKLPPVYGLNLLDKTLTDYEIHVSIINDLSAKVALSK